MDYTTSPWLWDFSHSLLWGIVCVFWRIKWLDTWDNSMPSSNIRFFFSIHPYFLTYSLKTKNKSVRCYCALQYTLLISVTLLKKTMTWSPPFINKYKNVSIKYMWFLLFLDSLLNLTKTILDLVNGSLFWELIERFTFPAWFRIQLTVIPDTGDFAYVMH